MKGWLTNRDKPSKMDRQTSQMDHWIDFKKLDWSENWIKNGCWMDVRTTSYDKSLGFTKLVMVAVTSFRITHLYRKIDGMTFC